MANAFRCKAEKPHRVALEPSRTPCLFSKSLRIPFVVQSRWLRNRQAFRCELNPLLVHVNMRALIISSDRFEDSELAEPLRQL